MSEDAAAYACWQQPAEIVQCPQQSQSLRCRERQAHNFQELPAQGQQDCPCPWPYHLPWQVALSGLAMLQQQASLSMPGRSVPLPACSNIKTTGNHIKPPNAKEIAERCDGWQHGLANSTRHVIRKLRPSVTYSGFVTACSLQDLLAMSWQDGYMAVANVIQVLWHELLQLLITVTACHLEGLHVYVKAQRFQELLGMATGARAITPASDVPAYNVTGGKARLQKRVTHDNNIRRLKGCQR